MTHDEKITWMALWAVRNRVTLDLQGECGIGRECVGVCTNGSYLDYHWHDDEYQRVDPNGDVWVPPSAYRKHDCVAVLGRGVVAEEQLYDWLKWFDDRGFVVETGMNPAPAGGWGTIDLLFGNPHYARIVRPPKAKEPSDEAGQ